MSLDSFQPLGDGISIFNSPAHDRYHDNDDDGPALIILCTWLGGATAKRIQRYTRGYNTLWPKARILLIRTTATEYAFLGVQSLQRKLRPAHCEIRKTLSRESNKLPQILLHIFSNGGANIATQLVASTNRILRATGQKSPLPLRQIIFDSCPGDLPIQKTYQAAAHSIPATLPLRSLGCAVLYLVVAGIAGLEAVGLRKPLAKSMREGFNDRRIFAEEARRLYLTSKGDTIVETGEVRTHWEGAKGKGLKTEMVVFERAGHCCLLMEDEEAYWGAVEKCWERSRQYSLRMEEEKEDAGNGMAMGALPQTRSRL